MLRLSVFLSFSLVYHFSLSLLLFPAPFFFIKAPISYFGLDLYLSTFKSEWLAEVFATLDTTSDSITLHISPDKPFFRLVTHGQAGSMQVSMGM